jgi:hypothetical protein
MIAPAATCLICPDPAINAHLFPRALPHDIRAEHKHLFVGSAGFSGPSNCSIGIGR